MSNLDQRAAALNAAWRNAQDLAPIPWAQVDERERVIWQTVATVAVLGATDERDQWTIAVAEGSTKGKPHLVLTSTNGEVVLSGEVRTSRRGAQDTAAQLVEAGLRGFRHEQ